MTATNMCSNFGSKWSSPPFCNRSGIMENMERLLNIWTEDQHQRDSPCSLLSIQAKALGLFENLKQQDGDRAKI